MEEVFCVMECHNGDDDIMPVLVAIHSTLELAMEFIGAATEIGERVVFRVERWDIDGATSNPVIASERDSDVLVDQTVGKK